MPLFSVIIPTWNRAALVTKAVDSVLSQEFTDFEVVVVDDGSTDATREALGPYAGRVRVLHQQNQGPGPARNAGIAAAAGRYVAFLDSDDRWFPWTLGTYRRAITAFHDPAILVGSVGYFEDERGFRSLLESLSAQGAGAAEPDFAVYENYLATAGAGEGFFRGTGVSVFRADALRAVGGLVRLPIYCEDLDLLIRMGTAGRLVHVRRPALIALLRHAGGSLSDMDRTCRGARYLVEQERAGRYPGGSEFEPQRLDLIYDQLRNVSWQCLMKGRTRLGLDCFRRGFVRNLRGRRLRYLLGYPLMALVPPLRRRLAR